MTPAEFTQKWKRSPIVKFTLSSPLSSGLSECSVSTLKNFGLPQSAEPWLSFMEFVMTDSFPAADLNERDLFPIGSLANGSFICIEKSSDRVVIFDRDDPEELWVLNRSLQSLYDSIDIFDTFIAEVNRRNPAFSWDFRIPDGMLDELRQKLTGCDPESMEAKGYWYCELGVLDDSAV